jgi:hypothetical protein
MGLAPLWPDGVQTTRSSSLLLALGFATLGLVTRLPFLGSVLAGWDSVQYALGLVQFDVVAHQPHPPGSILYVALGRLLLAVTGEANRALELLSLGANALAVALCFVVGEQLFGRRIALLGAALYLTSPLVWYYGVVALPYSLEAALSLGIVSLCWRAAEDGDRRAALAAAVILAVAGGVRPTTMLLLLPLWAFAAVRARSASPASLPTHAPCFHTLIAGLALMAVLCLAWLVPLLVLSGGPARYLMASRELSSLVSSLSSAFAIGPPALAANLSYIWEVTTFGLNLSLACFAIYLLPGVRWPWQPSLAQRWFLALWAAPALAVYVLLHIGQAGYLLLLWPLACYAAATAILDAGRIIGQYLARRSRPAGARRTTNGERRRAAAGRGEPLVLHAVATRGPALVYRGWPARLDALPAGDGRPPPPRAGRRVVGMSRGVCRATAAIAGAALGAGSVLFLSPPLAGGPLNGLSAAQVRETGREWQALQELGRTLDPATTVVLTGSGTSESFRLAEYYLPQFHVLAIGLDRRGRLGVVFGAFEGHHSYAAFMASRPAIRTFPLPEGTRQLLVLDRSTADLLPAGALAPLALTPRRTIWRYPAADGRSAILDRLDFPDPLQVVGRLSGQDGAR